MKKCNLSRKQQSTKIINIVDNFYIKLQKHEARKNPDLKKMCAEKVGFVWMECDCSVTAHSQRIVDLVLEGCQTIFVPTNVNDLT